jgi:isocitrate dehydrogenase (NAD+)
MFNKAHHALTTNLRPGVSAQIKRNYYNMSYIQRPGAAKRQEVTLIPGKYIGPEVTTSVVDIFEALGVPIDFKRLDRFDFDNLDDRTKLRSNKTILLGSLGRKMERSTPSGSKKGWYNHSAFYKYMDLYVKAIHCHSMPGVKYKFKNVDLVIIRGGLEGEYSNIEHEVYPGVFESNFLLFDEK